MKKLIIPISLFIPFAALQLLVAPIITFNHVGPDLLIILFAFYGVRYGHIFGSLFGFFGGFIFDLISGGLLGGAMFAYTLAGFLAGYFYKEDEYQHLHSFKFLGVVFISASVSSFLASIFSGSEFNSSLLFLLFKEGILPGIYTALLSFPVLFIKTESGIE